VGTILHSGGRTGGVRRQRRARPTISDSRKKKENGEIQSVACKVVEVWVWEGGGDWNILDMGKKQNRETGGKRKKRTQIFGEQVVTQTSGRCPVGKGGGEKRLLPDTTRNHQRQR